MKMQKEIVQATHITSDLYTNSYLISPIADQEKIKEFWWTRKNGLFFKSKIVISAQNASYYQCTLFDYKAIIQLHIQDHDKNQRIFTYGPIKLQADLEPMLIGVKGLDQKFQVKVLFGRSEFFDAMMAILGQSGKVQVEVKLSGNTKLNIVSPFTEQDDLYQSFIKIDQTETNRLDLNFLRSKKAIVEVLKKLKIYSFEGNYLKFFFKSQYHRDMFLYIFYSAHGFKFDWRNSFTDSPQHDSFQKEISIKQCEIGSIPKQPPHLSPDHGLQDICQMLTTPKNFEKETAQLDQSPILNPNPSLSESIEQQVSIEPKLLKIKAQTSEQPLKKQGQKVLPQKKIERKKPAFTYEPKERMKPYPYSGKNQNKTHQAAIIHYQNTQMEQKISQAEHQERKEKQVIEKREQPTQIPQFIKKMMINKAIHKAYHENLISKAEKGVRERTVSRQDKKIIGEKNLPQRHSSTSPFKHEAIPRAHHPSKNKDSGLKFVNQYFKTSIPSPNIKSYEQLPHYRISHAQNPYSKPLRAHFPPANYCVPSPQRVPSNFQH